MTCRFCGSDAPGQPFEKWVKKTFMDWDKLLPGDVVCNECLFWFEEKSPVLTERTGKEKLQRMRNYSHFVVGGEWTPLSKGDKARMAELLLSGPFPELAAIAESGQKHIVFRARRNPPGGAAGWVQFEEQTVYVRPEELRALLDAIERLYVTFSKTEIGTARYSAWRIMEYGVEAWYDAEELLRPRRGEVLFDLALFLAQREEADDGQTRDEGTGGATPDDPLAGDTDGLQGEVPDEHLGAVREPDQERGLHEQPGEVRQLGLFEI